MKVFYAMIVDEPENAPMLLLSQTQEELLTKAKEELSWLDNIDEATTLESVEELYDGFYETEGGSYAMFVHGERNI
jgi:hypothetical protein